MKQIVRLPFDAEKAKNGAKVVTRDGKSVRIVCYDRYCKDFPIIGLIRLYSDFELMCTFTPDGHYNFEDNEDKDLFIEEEEVKEQKPQFKPYDRVLVRDNGNDTWRCDLFSHFHSKYNLFICVGCAWGQCIPYKGNEHLVGTKDSPK